MESHMAALWIRCVKRFSTVTQSDVLFGDLLTTGDSLNRIRVEIIAVFSLNL